MIMEGYEGRKPKQRPGAAGGGAFDGQHEGGALSGDENPAEGKIAEPTAPLRGSKSKVNTKSTKWTEADDERLTTQYYIYKEIGVWHHVLAGHLAPRSAKEIKRRARALGLTDAGVSDGEASDSVASDAPSLPPSLPASLPASQPASAPPSRPPSAAPSDAECDAEDEPMRRPSEPWPQPPSEPPSDAESEAKEPAARKCEDALAAEMRKAPSKEGDENMPPPLDVQLSKDPLLSLSSSGGATWLDASLQKKRPRAIVDEDLD